MKVLKLTLKRKWFDLIASGEKKEEYRELKPYYFQRIVVDYHSSQVTSEQMSSEFKKYDYVEFKHGYAKDAPTMLVECKGIRIKDAKPEWSDNAKGKFFAIQLGKIIERRNFKSK